jgi:methyl-accepting chemotaxis protein
MVTSAIGNAGRIDASVDRGIDLTRRIEGSGGAIAYVNGLLARLEGGIEPLLGESISISQVAFKLDADVGALRDFSRLQLNSLKEIDALAESSGKAAEGIAGMTEDLYAAADRARAVSSASAKRQSSFLDEMAFIRRTLGETSESMEALAKESEAIGALVAIIEDLASQLNVLSINASIEAVRAGAAGKGFAVIAKEMRGLQERTNRSASEVGSKISGVIEGIGQASARMAQSRGAAERGEADARAISERLSELDGVNGGIDARAGQIRELVRGQLEQSSAILRLSSRLTEEGRAIDGKSEESKRGAEELHRVVDALNATISGFRFAWHARLAEALDGAIAAIEDPARPEAALARAFPLQPCFELFYAMDGSGVQVSGNVQNPAYDFIDGGERARGAMRGDREYFLGAIQSDGACFSDIYVSSATKRLCLTVSRRFERGGLPYVLAGDIDLGGIMRLISGEGRPGPH